MHYNFTGHIFDDKTELNYMGARYHDGDAGKFMSQDPVAKDNSEAFLSDPQQLNTPRTMGKSNSASEFNSQKNTRSKNKSISIQDEYLAKYYNWDEYLMNPQLQNSYCFICIFMFVFYTI